MNKHLKFIDSLVCVACGRPRPTHHHLLRVRREYLEPKAGFEEFLVPKYDGRGMAIKNPDCFAIPLCPACHQRLHLCGNERLFLAQCNINDPESFALELFSLSGQRDKALDIIRWRMLGNVQDF